MENLNTAAFKRNRILLYLIYLLLFVFAIVKVKENGDFIGYVNAGNLVLNHGDIYSDIFNTWPPAFSIISVPLALINNLSFVFVRFLWMIFIFFCFFFSIKSCVEFFENRKYTYRQFILEVLVQPFYLLALFLSCRAFMDNIIYMQINLVMLAACCYFMVSLDRQKKLLPALLLGVSIGAKVYNVMLLPVAILFRQWKSVAYVLTGIGITFLMCFMVFGVQQTIDYYLYWFHNIADVKQTIIHRNQSLITGLMRFFSMENLTVNQTYPLLDLKYSVINTIYMSLILVLVACYLYLFGGMLRKNNKDFIFHSFILVLTMVPLLTPVSWKANYIYALPAFFFMCHAIKYGKVTKPTKIYFTMAAIALCLSNEAIIGRPAMYFLETWNVLIIGELLLFVTVLFQMTRFKAVGQYAAERK